MASAGQLAMIIPLDGGAGNLPGHDLPSGVHPGHDLPSGGHPALPIEGYPDNGLPGGGMVGTPEHPIAVPPMPPQTKPPVAVWPGVPIHPDSPDNTLPLPPGTVWPPLPAGIKGKAICLVYMLGVGYRWVVIEAAPPTEATPKV